jgi:hypothetical protein
MTEVVHPLDGDAVACARARPGASRVGTSPTAKRSTPITMPTSSKFLGVTGEGDRDQLVRPRHGYDNV